MAEDFGLLSNKRACAVCNRESSLGTAYRMHYNVFCCEACKCFFRRSIQLKKKFSCKYFNQCFVSNNISRQFCKACRLKKCFQVGMMKESVKPKRNLIDSGLSMANSIPNSDVGDVVHSISIVDNESDKSSTTYSHGDKVLNRGHQGTNTNFSLNLPHQCSFDFSISNSNVDKSPLSHFHCETRTSNTKDIINSNSNEQNLLDRFDISNLNYKTTMVSASSFRDSTVEDVFIPKEKYDVASIEEVLDSLKIRILDLFKWAKRSLEFGKLSPNDQRSLLRYTVVELVMLGFARASIHYDDVLYFNHINKIIQPHHPNSAVACVTKLTIEKLVKPLRFLNINRTEYRIMKEIILYNPSSTTLEDLEMVRDMRRSRFRQLYFEASHDIGRFGDILSLLTPLFEVATEITEQLRLEQYVQESEATMDAFLLISLLQEGQVDD